jgi:hypothetical protein
MKKLLVSLSLIFALSTVAFADDGWIGTGDGKPAPTASTSPVMVVVVESVITSVIASIPK